MQKVTVTVDQIIEAANVATSMGQYNINVAGFLRMNLPGEFDIVVTPDQISEDDGASQEVASEETEEATATEGAAPDETATDAATAADSTETAASDAQTADTTETSSDTTAAPTEEATAGTTLGVDPAVAGGDTTVETEIDTTAQTGTTAQSAAPATAA